jgi:hypothetical protein
MKIIISTSVYENNYNPRGPWAAGIIIEFNYPRGPWAAGIKIFIIPPPKFWGEF